MADPSMPTGERRAHRASVLIELAFWLTLALIAFGLSFQFSAEPGTYRWGAASWPRAVILLMIVTAVVHATRRLRDGATATAPEEPAETAEAGGPAAVLGLFLIPLTYAWLLPRTGFYLTTPVFLIAFLLHVGERRLSVLLITTLIITSIAFLVFAKLFYVALPVGNWPGFYEANTWLLTVIR